MSDTTWEFTLRTGVKFHDGTPLTAEDVKATLERNLVPGKTTVQPGFSTIEAVQIANLTTIRVVTKKPDPLLPVRMAQMGAQIVPARLTTDEGVKELARRPVGSGAYRFVEWVKDERLVMEANRDWWGWEGRAPSVERKVGVRAKVSMMEMGARARLLNERTLPPNGCLLGNPQSTLLDADGSLWRLLNPNGLNGRYWIGSQPGQKFHDVMEQARYSLDPRKRREIYTEATRIIHEEKPYLELFQEVIVYGTSKRVVFKPRPDYRLIGAEMTVTR